MNTAIKVLSATMPTKNAAIHSMESMKRSMTFLRAGPGGPTMAPCRFTSGLAVMSSSGYRFELETVIPGCTRSVRTRNPEVAALDPCLVLPERRLQIGVDSAGVAAGLLHRRSPAVVQRLDGLLPLRELFRCQRIDLVACERLHLDAAIGFEFGPGVGDFL